MPQPKSSKKKLRKLQPKDLFRKEVLAVDLYQVAGTECAIKLNQNELPAAPRDIAKAVPADLQQPPLNRYPDEGSFRLREALAASLAWPVGGIAVANGSNVLVQAIMITCAVGGKVMTVTPTFPLYPLEAKILGNKYIEVPLNKDFSLPIDAFIKKLKKEKPDLVILANPNAPTANLFRDEDVLRIIETARCLVLLDEAYFPFSRKTFLPRLKEFPHLLILRTFSKSMGLAGLRLGYLLGHDEIVAQVEKVLLPFRLSQLVQNLAIAALAKASGETPDAEIMQERERVFSLLLSLPGVRPFRSDANFILFRVDHMIGGDEVFKLLMRHGILVRNFSKYPRLKECLRVTIGKRAENDAFMDRLRSILSHGKPST